MIYVTYKSHRDFPFSDQLVKHRETEKELFMIDNLLPALNQYLGPERDNGSQFINDSCNDAAVSLC